MKKIGKEIAWIGLYIVVFILIQLVIQFAFAGGYLVYYKMSLANLRNLLMSNITLTIVSTIVSSLITIFVFLKKGWASRSRDYLTSRPWATLLWVVVAAIGIIIPSMGLGELFKVDMPGELQMMFVRMMHNPFGYVLKCFFARNLIGLDVLSHGEYHPRLCTSLGQQHRCICCCQSHAGL